MTRFLPFVFCASCITPFLDFSPEPFQVEITDRLLTTPAAVEGRTTPTPFLIDTGSNITVYNDGSGDVGSDKPILRLYEDRAGALIPRVQLRDQTLFYSPLFPIGTPPRLLGGIVGGDVLQRAVFSLNPAANQVNFLTELLPCSCELEQACHPVFPFTLQGGTGSVTLETRLVIDDAQFLLAPSRIALDVCAEPLADPLQRNIPCSGPNQLDPQYRPQYLQTGTELKMLLATGFPGLLLSANSYDRLRGPGAFRELSMRGAAFPVFLPDRSEPMLVFQDRLGTCPDCSALAIVSRERYFGPCGELARSRRQRRSPPGAPNPLESACLMAPDPARTNPTVDLCLSGSSSNQDFCNDNLQPVAAIVELTSPIAVWVAEDTAPILVRLNADVRPRGATIDGVMGMEALRYLNMQIDYPKTRLLAHCSDSTGCLAYPSFRVAESFPGRINQQSGSDASMCDNRELCLPPSEIAGPFIEDRDPITGAARKVPARLGGICPADMP